MRVFFKLRTETIATQTEKKLRLNIVSIRILKVFKGRARISKPIFITSRFVVCLLMMMVLRRVTEHCWMIKASYKPHLYLKLRQLLDPHLPTKKKIHIKPYIAIRLWLILKVLLMIASFTLADLKTHTLYNKAYIARTISSI